MPPREIKIDHIERWNPDRIQRRVIVNKLAIQVSEMASQFQCLGRSKNISRHFRRRIRRQSNVKRTIAHHVEQETAPKLFRAGASKLLGKVTATVQTVGFRELFVRL